MAKVVIITKKCPCCKYEHRIMKHYEIVEENGKPVKKHLGEGIPRGKEDFKPKNVIGESGNIVTIAVECPKCGILVNPEKCTTKEEKEI